MYLKKIAIKDVGPIADLNIELPFDGDQPKPLVLVGPNGSGKSTFLSFIVNALINFKQFIHPNAEVEQGKVFRIRSPRFIRAGAESCHARVEFEDGLTMTEDTLNRAWKDFKTEATPKDLVDRWKRVKDDNQKSLFDLDPNRDDPRVRKLFGSNAVLYFPSDRFELPDWLNDRSLSEDLRFPEPTMFEGETNRRITSRALLKPTLEWMKHVLFDQKLEDYQPIALPNPNGAKSMVVFLEKHQRSWRVFNQTGAILGRVLGADGDRTSLSFGNRHRSTLGVSFTRSGKRIEIPTLLGLSAGEAAAFCLFANLIRDFDLSGAAFESLDDIRGIVLADEIDLHLHVDLQLHVLPRLIEAFPKVQFIVTAHSPLFVMGMREVFGDTGFEVRELPTASLIDVEEFSEFEHAFGAFQRTNRFGAELLQQVNSGGQPVIIVEGKTDKMHMEIAWKKLYSSDEMPWSIEVSGGVDADAKDGGADQLRTMLRGAAFHAQRLVLGVFDHDREGWPQFNSLKTTRGFEVVSDTHLKHKSRPVQACLLPVPATRNEFVDVLGKHFHLSIEHYYSDQLLEKAGLVNRLPGGSRVFEIKSGSDKTGFARLVADLDASEFEHFHILFDRLHELLGSHAPQPDAQEEQVLGPARDVGGTP